MLKEIVRFESVNKSINNEPIFSSLSFSIYKGETISIYGASVQEIFTLTHLINGKLIPESGSIYINERAFKLKKPLKRGLDIVQTIYNVSRMHDNLTMAENIFLGHESSFFFNKKNVNYAAKEYLDEVFIYDIPPNTLTRDITDEQKSLLELARIFYLHPQLVIFNQADLFDYTMTHLDLDRIFKKLNKIGVSVLYFSNTIELASTIGNKIATFYLGTCTSMIDKATYPSQDILKNLMPNINYKFVDKNNFNIYFQIKNLTGKQYVHNISLDLKKGEILGLYSLNENRTTELFYMLCGYTPIKSGELLIYNNHLNIKNIKSALDYGIVFCPPFDSTFYFHNLNLKDNILLSSFHKLNKFGFRNKRLEKYYFTRLVNKTALEKYNNTDYLDNYFFNDINKAFLARSLGCNPKVLLINNPFFQISYETEFDIINTLKSLSDSGCSIIIASNNLHKLYETCHRVIPLH